MNILFEEYNETGIITLNRPKALNALNLEMVNLFQNKLNEWIDNNKIKRVILKGKGKHFCAGGDVKSLFLSKNNKKIKKKFFKEEYKLNYLISSFPKDYLSIWNGVVMGGGVGLSIYGNYRLVNETSKLAMPESIIGFFPDVGASYFLSNLPNNFGKYLGLTGQTIKADEMIYFNLATNYCKLSKIESVIKNFINNGEVYNFEYNLDYNSEILQNLQMIEYFFDGNIYSIITKLKNSKTEFSIKILDILSKRCPMSLIVSCELIKRAKNKSLKQCLEMEFQLSQHMVYREDFDNGVEAVLVTKKHDQKWNPSNINYIDQKNIDKLFEPHTNKLGL